MKPKIVTFSLLFLGSVAFLVYKNQDLDADPSMATHDTGHAAAIKKQASTASVAQTNNTSRAPNGLSVYGSGSAEPPVVAPASTIATNIGDEERSRRIAPLRKRYDAFIKQRGLNEAQAEKFYDLKIKQADLGNDLQAAVREQGVTDSQQIKALRNKLDKPITTGFRDLLGEAGWDAYRAYESISFYRQAYVEPWSQELEMANLALTDDQLAQITGLVAANDRPVKLNPTDISTQSQLDWGAVIQGATPILTPIQLALLKRHAERYMNK